MIYFILTHTLLQVRQRNVKKKKKGRMFIWCKKGRCTVDFNDETPLIVLMIFSFDVLHYLHENMQWRHGFFFYSSFVTNNASFCCSISFFFSFVLRKLFKKIATLLLDSLNWTFHWSIWLPLTLITLNNRNDESLNR